MAELNIQIIGLKEFKNAIKRHPDEMRAEIQKFFSRAESKFKSRLRNKPWKVGQSGGGVPVLTGNLRDGMIGAGKAPMAELKNRKKDGVGHVYERGSMFLRIYPTASYAAPVHKNRPWLDYALKKEEPEIKNLEKDLLKKIVSNLAR